MERLQLNADVREQKGKGTARQLRREGLIPGVLYGLDRQPVNLKLNAKATSKVVGGNAIIDLTIDGETEPVMVKEVQRHPVKADLLHVDLYRIDLNEKVTVEVPVEIVGQAAGEREGGILEQILREIEIECLPTNIPEKIEADVSELAVGQSLSVGELTIDEDFEIITDADETLATVVVPTEIVEPEEDEEVELEEPEVIGEEPEEEEEAEEE